MKAQPLLLTVISFALPGLNLSSAPASPAPAKNSVRLEGKSFRDDAGPFLGLGASYFQALHDTKFDRARLDHNLALLSANGFNFIRVLSMVGWDRLEIAPVAFTNRTGKVVSAWPDYWDQFAGLLDAAQKHGLRVELTIFADAQHVMPGKADRQAHLEAVLAHIAGREDRLIYLEVANEAWQNGFPGTRGRDDLRAFAQFLTERTHVLVAISSPDDTSDQGIVSMYRGSAATLATVHFSRDARTTEGGWLPVRDCYRAAGLPGVPPVVSNEPIGPGSSVNSESDPVKLCSAAAFAYLAGLPGYVFHSRAGIYGWEKCCPPAGQRLPFEAVPGIDAFQHLRRILPPDVANWNRTDGLDLAAPFKVFCNGNPNRYWPEVSNPTNGCLRNVGSTKGNEFICLPIGILSGGVVLEPRRSVRFEVRKLSAAEVVTNLALGAGETWTLPQGPGAYLIRGRLAD